MSTIDREEAIRIIASYPGPVDKSVVRRLLTQMPNLQPNLQSTCNWIPVAEKLPELHEKVLACVDGRIFIDERELRGWRYRVTNYDAWMPLPKPYEGGEQDG